ncbi:MAG: mechanosensitive ion channel domain-containing protein [Planctomycetaceae bacterium]
MGWLVAGLWWGGPPAVAQPARGESRSEAAASPAAGARPRGESRRPVASPRLDAVRPMPILAEQPPAESQSPEAAPPGEPAADEALSEISEATLKSRLQRVQDDPELQTEERAELVALYRQALQALSEAAESDSRRGSLERLAEEAPELTVDLQRKVEAERPAAEQVINPKSTLGQLQAGLSRAEAELERWEQEVADAEAEKTQRSTRRLAAAEEEPELRAELETIEAGLERGPGEDVSEDLALAERGLLEARRRAVLARLSLLRQELLTYDLSGEWLVAKADLATVEAEYTRTLVEAWQTALNQRRRSDVSKQVDEAQVVAEKAALVAPRLKGIADRNVELTRQRVEVAGRIEEAQRVAEGVEQQTRELLEEFEQIDERVKRSGFNEVIAAMLRRRREQLPDAAMLTEQMRERSGQTASLGLQLAELQDQRSRLADLNSAVGRQAKLLAPAGGPLTAPESEALKTLLRAQRTYLDGLISDTGRSLETLLECDAADRALLKQARIYTRYCDENLLWIRSATPPGWTEAGRVVRGIQDWLQPALWSGLARGLLGDAVRHPAWYVGLVGLVLGCLAVTRQAAARVRQEVQRAEPRRRRAGWALAWLVAGSLAVPTLLWFCGWRLSALRLDVLSAAAGRALVGLAALLVPLRVVRMATRVERLAPGLMGLSPARSETWREVTARWAWVGLPLLTWTFAGATLAGNLPQTALGRLTFVLFQGLLAWGLTRLGPRLNSLEKESRPGGVAGEATSLATRWQQQLSAIWPGIALGVPGLFAGLSLWGYHNTAVLLCAWLLGVAGLGVGLSFIERLLAVCLAPRVVATAPATNEWGALDGGNAIWAPQGRGRTPSRTGLPELEDAVSQWRHLVHMGLVGVFVVGSCWILSPILPALAVFQSIEVWPRPFHWLDAGDADNVANVVTVAGVALAALLGVLTWFCQRTLPELLDVLVLSRTQLDQGGRYAVAAIARYAVLVSGSLAAFSQVGIGWAQLNWLVAAMTVGLGFGLQEIFANFVSGLILLFERPVRIGDIVSIGDITGKVSRIRMRATTITDNDLRELIVPNKELITGRVINWTLTDTVSRLTIKVKVAVGTDPDFARGLLLGVANRHRLVLRQPPAQAQFEEFADNALHFALRVCVASFDLVAQTRHELLTAIKKEFQEQGLALSIPTTTVGRPATPGVAPAPSSPAMAGGVGPGGVMVGTQSGTLAGTSAAVGVPPGMVPANISPANMLPGGGASGLAAPGPAAGASTVQMREDPPRGNVAPHLAPDRSRASYG